MQDDATEVIAAEPIQPNTHNWSGAFSILKEMLAVNGGWVSSRSLRERLERDLDLSDARGLVIDLQFFDPQSSSERGISPPDFKYHHWGRSFYSEEKYMEEMRAQEAATKKEAEEASREVSEEVDFAPEEIAVTRTYRQEEARMVTYVKAALDEIYQSDHNSDQRQFVFDVHSQRKGSSFENVDVIAIDWRSPNLCELISVEVKLDFNPLVVQQAMNYRRFSHRAWIAVPVATDSNSELREKNTGLFEYAIANGLGILACRRGKGRSYRIFPIHWPLRNQPSVLEQEEFHERYRDAFETAGVIESISRKRVPRLAW